MINKVKLIIENKYLSLYLKQFIEAVKKTQSVNGKNKLIISLDILESSVVYGASPNNYKQFEFYNLSNKEKKII